MPYYNYKFLKLFLISLLFFLFLFFYLLLQVFFKGNSFKPVSSDAIVVLGHALDYYHEPSDWLTARLEKALYLYNNDYAGKIIVSGGVGPRDSIPVSQGMKWWLVNRGVPYESILMESSANNTYENLKYSKSIAYHHDISSIIVVTNDFHMYRSMYIANMFFDNVSGSPAFAKFNFNKALAYMKEPLSIIKYTIVHRVNTWLL